MANNVLPDSAAKRLLKMYEDDLDNNLHPVDQAMRDAALANPQRVPLLFNHWPHGPTRPIAIHEWAWSDNFHRLSALVTFADGWFGFAYPMDYRSNS